MDPAADELPEARPEQQSPSSQPPPHFQEPAIVYTTATNTVANTMNEESFTRSATAPETMVAAVAANIAWNRKSVQ